MRFRILFTKQKQEIAAILPLNYQYELSSWIYKTLNYGSPEFSKWLHDIGYGTDNKRFKLFTFSGIKTNLYKVKEDRFIIEAPDASLIISFYLDEAAEPFITGLFRNQVFSIGDYKSRADFIINSVERLPDPKIVPVMQFKTLSPVVISIKEIDISKHAQYLGPQHELYSQLFFGNLMAKFNTVNNGMADLKANAKDYGLKILNTPRSKLVTIKTTTEQESKIRGYTYDFEISAPEELIKIGLDAGFGEKNSLGFGCGEVR